MPKKGTGYTPKKSKSNPTEKMSSPMKTPSIKETSLPTQMSGTVNKTASLPNTRFPKLTRPAALAPRTPRI